jgi:signal peptidase II
MKNNIATFIGLIAFLLDQISKALVSRYIEFHTAINIMPSFNLVHIQNKGISFGLFSNHSSYGPYVLAFVSLCIVSIMAFWANKTKCKTQKIAFGLIIGGALGNIWDRLTDKAVTDFLDFYLHSYHWPAFNFADVAIFCGAALLLLNSFISTSKEHKNHAR